VQVSDISVVDYSGDYDTTSDSISFDGIISLSAKAVGNDSLIHEIGYSLNVSASVDYSWETDERPTGWNYSRDDATYSYSTSAVISDVEIHLLSPDTESTCYFDNEEVSMETLQQNLPPATQKQLLNPAIIAGHMENGFQDQAEKLDPPSKDDYDDYERDDGRYDDYDGEY
jgi:hypothetical protein